MKQSPGRGCGPGGCREANPDTHHHISQGSETEVTATVTEIRPEQSQRDLIASVITQLDDAAQFLATVPGVKITQLAEAPITYYAASAEEVDEIAAAIGGTASWNQNLYRVKRSFGPEVAYMAVYIDKGREDDSAQPERPAAA